MMFSQLCRARPRTLWNKFSARQPPTDELYSVSNCPQDIRDDENGAEENRCQLEHCTFCDYRFCCQVITNSSGQLSTELDSHDHEIKATENPAYGLSSKTWQQVTDVKTREHVLSDEKEPPQNDSELNENIKSSDSSNLKSEDTSQSDQDCDNNTAPMKMYQFNVLAQSTVPQNKIDCKSTDTEDAEKINSEPSQQTDANHGALTWSVLKHKPFGGETFKSCDNKSPSHVIEHSKSDALNSDTQTSHSTKGIETSSPAKPKRSMKDRTFPLSLMKPVVKTADFSSPQSFPYKNDLSRQGPVQKTSRERFQNVAIHKELTKSKRFIYDSAHVKDPLSDIAKIKTEESIQEWLARIGEPNHSSWSEESTVERKKEISPHDDGEAWHSQRKGVSATDKGGSGSKPYSGQHADGKMFPPSTGSPCEQTRSELTKHGEEPPKGGNEMDAKGTLNSATKASPANVPMVIMQCSRLHSHIGSKPPFQQTSLPMGTLVTALYQESDWLYVQTPHGVGGFVAASHCVPIGPTSDAAAARRPWEPCDFPIRIDAQRRCEFGRQHESYVRARLPPNGGKQAVPYVSTVEMKTNFYSDRYFSHTFKSKDSIKTAKTVTDILRSSPETKVSN